MSRWIVACLFATMALAAPPRLDHLRCEYLADPVGIDIVRPRLGWQLVSSEAGQRQTAYQVQVASSPELLARGRGDRWDSGKVVSSQSTQVVYAGQPLASRQRCAWRVRVWDKDGAVSSWSQPASWSMGLLAPGDWKAKWIGPTAQAATPMGWGNAAWVWFAEEKFGPGREAPAGQRFLRRTFVAPAGVAKARLAISADDQYQLWLNDKQVARSDGQGDAWRRPQLVDLSAGLRAGENVLAVQAVNGANESGITPAGVLARLVMETADGKSTELVTDAAWKASSRAAAGWRAPGFDDSAWPAAVVQVKVGEQPWGPIADATQAAGAAVSPMLRRPFAVAKALRAAQVSVCGLGYHELYLDGKKVGDHVLDPAITQYDKRALYVTHDLTPLLRPGRHALGVQLANGEFNQWVSDAWSFHRAPWLSSPRLRLQLDLEYTDGSREQVVSDGSWKQANGPLTFDLTRVGTTWDARLEQPGWATAAFDDKAWQPATEVNGPTGVLRAQRAEPIKIVRTLPVAKWTEPKPGVWLANIGQNMTGWTRLTIAGPAGTTVTLRHGERINADGTLNQADIASLVHNPTFQTDVYTLAGRGTETFETRFAFHGFQYVEVTGLPTPPTAQTLVALQVRTSFDRAGTFECSNDLLNRIEKLAQWSYESNFIGFPSDCPHREKNGWTGDAQLACEMGLLHYRGEAAYTRWLDDFADAQQPNGKLPCIVPTPGWGYNTLDGPAWESAYVLIPWWLYEYRGDARILADHYDRMKRWVDYFAATAKDDIVTYGLGDWCPWKTQTPSSLTSTGYVIQSARVVAKAAALLGKKDDQARYEALAERLKAGFNHAFYKADGATYANGGQTSLSCALYQDLVPADQKPRVVQSLVDAVNKTDGHLDVGILGSKYLLRTLSDNGHADVAYRIASQKTQPSWGWWLSQGATSMWETWGTGASLNHIMFGDISAWFIEYLAGIRPDAAQPGFQHFLVKPTPVGDLTSARATHDSPYGTIIVDWKLSGRHFELNLLVPPNSSAAVTLPGQTTPREVGSGTHKLSCDLGT
ncbi:MAG: family 78 glycoside hydrolase catalytic domain [Armatimonadetes bacterium]|nr:family 78 glycoside hydrolase catalytic domain [Armatimonadota bacterium]